MKFFKKSDIFIILAIMLTSAVLWAFYNTRNSDTPAKAEIYHKSELIKTIELDKGQDMKFSIPEDKHVIFHLSSDGKIRFEDSDCPDKICVKTGWLSKVGQTAACLPNEMFLKIVPRNNVANDNDIDMIIGK